MHKLRHRYASRGYAGTKDIRAVQEALGARQRGDDAAIYCGDEP